MQRLLWRPLTINLAASGINTPAARRLMVTLTITMVFGLSLVARSVTTNAPPPAPNYTTLIGQGTPAIVILISDYCAACTDLTATIPATLADTHTLLLDIHSQDGRRFRAEYPTTYAPEYLLFDGSGQVIWRDNIPPAPDLLDSLPAW